ncbi:hypothetical protein HBA91_18645, partial [Ochrobactrum sp. MR34]|nr:hypothetical protein [Ochrobactrum sp. MR34]
MLGSVLIAGHANADEEHKQVWRLFVADHTKPVVRAIDLESGKELGKFDLKGYAALAASNSGETVFAVQTEDDVVNVIKTGIKL